MIYEWRDGSRIKLDPQRAGERLEYLRMRSPDRKVSPAMVLEDARRPRSPLHSHFEWNDTVAAEAFRIDQARHLILCSVAIRDDSPKETLPVRSFVLVDEGEERGYTSIFVAMSDERQRHQVLDRALRELQQWERKYAELEELAVVFAAARQAREKIPA